MNTRKYSRTMAEAFGPYTSNQRECEAIKHGCTCPVFDNCEGGKWLTVFYRDIQPRDESRTIGEHPKVSALGWLHALHTLFEPQAVDAALAAQAKQGKQQ